MEWFDSHCHLQDTYLPGAASERTGPAPEAGTASHGRAAACPVDDTGDDSVEDGRLAGVLARAAEAGVTRLVCVGTDASTSRQAVDLVRSLRAPGSSARAEGVEVWATVGLHPHDAVDGLEQTVTVLEEALAPAPGTTLAPAHGTTLAPAHGTTLALAPGTARGAGDQGVVVGIGECGLDYHYDHSPRSVQREVFAAQVALARRLGLALVVHTRQAWDDTLDVLRGEGVPERTVIHCFTGGPEEARRCLDLGAVLSFSGVVTFKNAADVREAAALCPVDRMLVETDAPFLAPVPHRGSANEPSRVPLVGAVVANCQGRDREELAAVTTANARAFFRI
ncbi:MAG: TatD family hydrolase [Acidimicrobiales bacterium]